MREYIEKAMTFAEYAKLIDDLLAEGKTTGPKQSDALYNYGKLNRQRMHRLDATIKLEESLKQKLHGLKRKMIWLVITEGWCGDASQNVPIIEKIAAENENIETRYILRDANLDLMDQYLTDGARSIPKLIVLDAKTLQVLGTWGARPKAAQDYFIEMMEEGLEKSYIMEKLQRWYNEDKSRSMQKEFEILLGECETKIYQSSVQRDAWLKKVS